MILSGKTVLLVEDDDTIRKLIKKILAVAGLHVLEADSGLMALRLVRESSQPIDLLLSDVVMPEMSGEEVAEKILEIQPGIKILFTSGYPDKHISLPGESDREVNFISKPFTRSDLLEKIKEILEKSS